MERLYEGLGIIFSLIGLGIVIALGLYGFPNITIHKHYKENKHENTKSKE